MRAVFLVAALLLAAPGFAQKVGLEWDASPAVDVEFYRIFRCSLGGPFPYHFKPIYQVDSTTLTYTDQAPEDIPRHLYYVVTIFKDGRESTPSNVVDISPGANLESPVVSAVLEPDTTVEEVFSDTPTNWGFYHPLATRVTATTATIAWKTGIECITVFKLIESDGVTVRTTVTEKIPIKDHVIDFSGLVSGKKYNYEIILQETPGIDLWFAGGSFLTK